MKTMGLGSSDWKVLGLSAAVALGCVSGLYGHGVVDQSFTAFNGSSLVFSDGSATQTFTPTKACLVGVDVYVVPVGATGTGTVAVNLSTTTGPVVATAGNSAQMYHTGWLHIDMPPTAVTPGTQMKLAIANSDARFRWAYAPNGYAGGVAGHSNGTMGGNDWLFRTYGADTCNHPPPPPGCAYALSLAGASIHSSKYAWDTTVTTGAACPWTAASPVPWVQVYPLNGTGTQTVKSTLFPNYSTASRAATLIIGGRNLTVNQAGNTGTADQRFVQMLYFNSFGRVPSQDEINFHVSTLPTVGRAELARRFMNVPEFNQGARWVAGLYVGLLNRNAEFGGWQFQRDAYSQGIVNGSSLVTNFLNSAEYISKFGTPDNSEFVRLLYRYILLREASQPEVNFQVGALVAGTPRASLAFNFLNSLEFRNGTGPRLTAFLLYAVLLGRDGTGPELAALEQQVPTTELLTLIGNIVNAAEFNNQFTASVPAK